MRYVSGDTLAHVMLVSVRDIRKVGGAAMKRTGGGLPVTQQDQKNLVLCRQLLHRFLAGDYRMTRMEYVQFRQASYWVQRQDRLNKGHPEMPPDHEDVSDKHVWKLTSMPPGTFEGLLGLLADGTMDTMAAPQ